MKTARDNFFSTSLGCDKTFRRCALVVVWTCLIMGQCQGRDTA
jgi:hypothetical protein